MALVIWRLPCGLDRSQNQGRGPSRPALAPVGGVRPSRRRLSPAPWQRSGSNAKNPTRRGVTLPKSNAMPGNPTQNIFLRPRSGRPGEGGRGGKGKREGKEEIRREMEGGMECGRASDAQNPTRCKSLYPTRKSNAVAVVRANPTRKSNAKLRGNASRPNFAHGRYEPFLRGIQSPTEGSGSRKSNAKIQRGQARPLLQRVGAPCAAAPLSKPERSRREGRRWPESRLARVLSH